MVCLFGLDRRFVTRRTLTRSVAIHSPPIYAPCHRASKITPGTRTLFFSFFWVGSKTNALRSILAIIQTTCSIFPPAWDRLFLLNVALAELRSRPLTWSDCKRLATPARVKVAPIWTFSCPNAGRAHHQTSTVFHGSWKKRQSFTKPC